MRKGPGRKSRTVWLFDVEHGTGVGPGPLGVGLQGCVGIDAFVAGGEFPQHDRAVFKETSPETAAARASVVPDQQTVVKEGVVWFEQPEHEFAVSVHGRFRPQGRRREQTGIHGTVEGVVRRYDLFETPYQKIVTRRSSFPRGRLGRSRDTVDDAQCHDAPSYPA